MPRVATVAIEIRVTFRAPLRFVFDWCTDYTPHDPALEGDSYARRILSRDDGRVEYEDLDSSAAGWQWSRWTVSLHPPDAWQATSVGNYRDWSVDYRLRSRSDGGTELTLRGRRRPTALASKGPTRAEIERNLGANWKKYARAFETDFRASQRKGRVRSRAGR
ncbi:MAG: hypothetical protein L3K16_03980 [Thermoplasmata archaeon]|nr:hypothetical protein [Thermoplasmata archaeon]